MPAFFEKQHASRNGVTQAITVSTSSAGATNPFGSQTRQVRLATTLASFYRIGDGAQTAVATDALLPAGVVEYVTVNPGQSIAAISTGAGTFTVTELS
jgi:hypothetical protein